MSAEINRLLEFWMGSSNPDEMASYRDEWWVKNDEFDRRINDDFGTLYEQAANGKLDSWKETPLGCVALVILLDQFPRNMFRGDPRSFATDPQARDLTRYVLDKGFDQEVPMGCKVFLYLPLEHSEDLDHQNACVALMQAMGNENATEFAIKHQVIIERFGRFPHRNEVLGRKSTPEEIEFLKEPGSSF